MRKRRTILLKAASAALGIVFALVLLEIGLRLAGVRFDASLYSRDPILGWSLRPGSEGWSVTEGEAYVHINLHGRRDAHDAVEKSLDTFRIALLGDSIVEARQVALEDTFATLLEDKLATCLPSMKHSVEVFNFGVPGYGTAQELLMLGSRVWKYDPDLVILGIFMGNDLHDNHPALNYSPGARPFFVYSGNELVLDESYRSRPEFQPQSIRRSNLMRELLNRSRALLVLRAASTPVRLMFRGKAADESPNGLPPNHMQTLMYVRPTHPYAQEAWRVTEGLILEVAREVRDHGADFAAVLFPMSMQIHPDDSARRTFLDELGSADLLYADRRLADLFQRHDLPLLLMTSRLAEHARANDIYLTGFENTPPGEGHYNETGHLLIAEAMTAFLCERVSAREPSRGQR